LNATDVHPLILEFLQEICISDRVYHFEGKYQPKDRGGGVFRQEETNDPEGWSCDLKKS